MKERYCKIGIGVGAAAIIMGIVLLGMPVGTKEVYPASFGGDFYTYMFRVTRYATENIAYLSDIARKGFGFLLIIIGATDICLFGCKLQPASPQLVPAAEAAAVPTIRNEDAAEAKAEKMAVDHVDDMNDMDDIAAELPEI